MTWNGLAHTAGLVCDPLLDGPVSAFTERVFLGHATWIPSSRWVLLPIGAGQDFTVEFVIRQIPAWVDTGAPGDAVWDIGLSDGSDILASGDPWGMRFSQFGGGTADLAGTAGTFGGGPVIDTGSMAPGTWHHVSLEFDRDGLLSGFLDAIAFNTVATVDISAGAASDLSAFGSFPLVAESDSLGNWDALNDLPAGLEVPPVMLGHYAVHSRLLTPGERAANAAAKTVGQYTETMVRYGPFVMSGPTSDLVKVLDVTNLSVSCKWQLAGAYLSTAAVFESTESAALMGDLSGNGKDFNCDALPSYASDVLTNRAIFGTADVAIT